MSNTGAFDVQIAFGRSMLNKVLAAVEASSVWMPPLEGANETVLKDQISTRTEYSLSLLRPRIRPSREQVDGVSQEGANISELGLWIDVVGYMHVVVNGPLNRPIVDYRCSLDGTFSVVARAQLRVEAAGHRLGVSFSDATVQHLRMTNGPDDDCLVPLISRATEHIVQTELRKANRDLPLTGLLRLTANPFGKLAAVSAKSHFYRTEAGDLALGLAMALAPGAAPPFRLQPHELRPGASGDVVLSLSLDYLNRALANAVADLTRQQWRFGGSWDHAAKRAGILEPFDLSSIRSVVLRLENDRIILLLRIGFDRTEVLGRVRMRPESRDKELHLLIEDASLDLPGSAGLARKLLLAPVYYLVKFVVENIAQRQLAVRLREVDHLGSGVVISMGFFGGGPADTTVEAGIRDVILNTGELIFVYDSNVRIASRR